MLHLTARNFESETTHTHLPVVIMFYANWCGKCAMMEDVVDLVAANCGGVLKVCQIEIEDSADLAEQFQVEIVPTFVIFKNGEPVSAASGVLNRQVVLDMVMDEAGLEIQG